MAQEMYFLYLDGVQRGPYTVHQIGHMVNSGIIHSEAMFWCEGLDQWQPVTQLITPKSEIKKRRLRLGIGSVVGLLIALALGWFIYPALRQVWKEQHQVDVTPRAAYWRARGVLREHLGTLSAVNFGDFNPVDVRISPDKSADVELSVLGREGSGEVLHWKVQVRYDERLKMWVPSGAVPSKK